MEGTARAAASSRSGLNADQVNFAFAVAEGAIKAKTKGQYPAPLVALKAIREGCNLTLEEGLKAEQKAFGELAGSPIAANLIGIFFMKNRLARDPGVSDPAVKPRPVKQRRRAGGRARWGRASPRRTLARASATAMVDVDDARLADGLKRALGRGHEPDQDRPRHARRTWRTCSHC